MSNYTQTTFFTPKDSLPSGNPAKVIYGAAYDVEFGNIASAITSKYDSNTTTITLTGALNSGSLAVSGASILGGGSQSGSAVLTVNGTQPVSIVGNSIQPALQIFGNTSVGNSSGLLVEAGYNGTDNLAIFKNYGGNTALAIYGDGTITAGSPAGSEGLGTINAQNGVYVNGVSLKTSGSFTATLTGMTSLTQGTINYEITGKICTLTAINIIQGTSNTTALTFTGLPAPCIPATGSPFVPCILINATGVYLGAALLTAGSGTVAFSIMQTASAGAGSNIGLQSSGFTNSGNKGLYTGWTITYLLN